jgi:hypothetical protein
LEFTSVRVAFTLVRRSNPEGEPLQSVPLTADDLRYAIEAALPRELGGGLVEVGAVEFAKMGDFVTTDRGFEAANLHEDLRGVLDPGADVVDAEEEQEESLDLPPGMQVMSLQEFMDSLKRGELPGQRSPLKDAKVDVRKLLGPAQDDEGTAPLIGPHGVGCECPWPEDKIN